LTDRRGQDCTVAEVRCQATSRHSHLQTEANQGSGPSDPDSLPLFFLRTKAWDDFRDSQTGEARTSNTSRLRLTAKLLGSVGRPGSRLGQQPSFRPVLQNERERLRDLSSGWD